MHELCVFTVVLGVDIIVSASRYLQTFLKNGLEIFILKLVYTETCMVFGPIFRELLCFGYLDIKKFTAATNSIEMYIKEQLNFENWVISLPDCPNNIDAAHLNKCPGGPSAYS